MDSGKLLRIVTRQYPCVRAFVSQGFSTSKKIPSRHAIFAGDGGRKYLLKEKSYYIQPDEYVFHLKYQRFIQSNGGESEIVVETNSGELFISIHGALYRLSEWIDGRKIDPGNYKELREMGRSLGRLHVLSEKFRPLPRNGWAFPLARSKTYPYNSEGWELLLQRFLNKENSADLYVRYGPFQYLCDLIRENARIVSEFNLPGVVVHGDAHPYNFIVAKNGKGVFWVDFEDARLDHKIVELAWACLTTGFFTWSANSDVCSLSPHPNLKVVDSILKGYLDANHLCSNEKRCFTQIMQLHLLATFANQMDMQQIRADFFVFKNWINQLLSVSANIRKIEL